MSSRFWHSFTMGLLLGDKCAVRQTSVLCILRIKETISKRYEKQRAVISSYKCADTFRHYHNERVSKSISIEMIEVNEDTLLNTIFEKYPSHRVFSMINIITSNQSPSLVEWIINGHIDNKSCMVIEDIKKKNKPLWEKLLIIPEATATFDMSKRGITFFDTKRFKQNYKL